MVTRVLKTMSRVLALTALVLVGCTDEVAVPAPDSVIDSQDQGAGSEAGVDMALLDAGPGHDAPPSVDGPPPLKVINETEPNNGGTKTEFNSVTAPIQIKGAIGQAEDADLFGLSAPAGARFSVTVKGDGALQPHVVIFDLNNKLPVAASNGATQALAEYYVLQAAKPLLIVVRDRRNVPASASQKVGGSTFTYTLTVQPLLRAPLQIAVGGAQGSTLSPRGTVRVFAFTAAKNTDLDLEALVIAPADIDARISLFYVGNKSWHGTNEAPAQLGAQLSGKMPLSGTYHAVVENVADDPTTFDFTFKITKK